MNEIDFAVGDRVEVERAAFGMAPGPGLLGTISGRAWEQYLVVLDDGIEQPNGEKWTALAAPDSILTPSTAPPRSMLGFR